MTSGTTLLLLAVVADSLSLNMANGCPSGWQTWNASDSCYIVVGLRSNESQPWNEALADCTYIQSRSTLVTIHSSSEQRFVAGLLQKTATNVASVFIGLNSRGTRQGYQWVDGSPVSYTHWKSGFVSSQGKDCIAMDTASGFWTDRFCDDLTGFVCKMRRTDLPPKPPQQLPKTSSLHCIAGWYQYGTQCYKYSSTIKKSYGDAEADCIAVKAHLVSISSVYEQAFLLSEFKEFSFTTSKTWIGLNDRAMEGEYHWTDGSSVEYSNWAPKEPSSTGGHGVCMLLSSGLWAAQQHSVRQSYICERSADQHSPPQPVTTVNCSTAWLAYDNHCYLIQTGSKETYSYAQATCKSSHSHLVRVDDVYENAFLVSQFPLAGGDDQHPVWIGLNDMIAEGTYVWTDGWPVMFTSWRPHEPNDLNHEDCTELFVKPDDHLADGFWNDKACTSLRGYVCESSSSTAAPTKQPQPTSATTLPCPTGWIRHGIYCFMLEISVKMSWTAARDRCLLYGSDLISIHSLSEQSFVANNAQQRSYERLWLGLNDRNTEGGYTWSDGSPVAFTTWTQHEPNDQTGSSDCVEMYTSRTTANWDDVGCGNPRNFGCKILAGSTLPTHIPTLPPYYKHPCEAGWVGHGPYCYLFVGKTSADRKTWTEAQDACSQQSSNLASITSLDEQEFLSNHVKDINDVDFTKHMFIGINDREREGTFVWADGSPVSFTYWNYGEPSSAHEDCGELVRGLYWNDKECWESHSYICKKLRLGVTVPSLVLPNTTHIVGYCPAGWKTYLGSCYRIYDNDYLAWPYAESFCESLGGHLVSLLSAAETTFVVNTMMSSLSVRGVVWIGLNDRENEHSYQWTDSSPVIISSWDRYQPSDYDGVFNCALLTAGTGRWRDMSCAVSLPFICKMSKKRYPVYPATCQSTYQQCDHCTAVKCPANCSVDSITAPVWGWQVYTGDSSICYAAIQNGLISSADGGNVTVVSLPSRGVYGSFSANGVVSQQHGPSDSSFTFHFSVTLACDPGWILHDYSCYLIMGGSPQVETTWTDARQQCTNEGGFLTSITDRFEHAYLLSQLPATIGQVWIGLHTRGGTNANDYSWVDGSPFEFQSWARGQPTDEDQTDRCVQMNPIGGEQPGLWISANCNSKCGFVCKKMRDVESLPTVLPTSSTFSCPPDWVTFQSSCYWIPSPDCSNSQCQLNWRDAGAACTQIYPHAHLVSINSVNELLFCRRWLHSVQWSLLWIGLNDEEVEGRYMWSDASLSNGSVLYWQDGQPDDEGHSENCVAINAAAGTFSDQKCDETLVPYVCELKRNQVPANLRPPSHSHVPGKSLSAGVVAAIVVVVLLAVVCAIAAGMCFVIRRGRNKETSGEYQLMRKTEDGSRSEDDEDDDGGGDGDVPPLQFES